jgi:hypothetical protein
MPLVGGGGAGNTAGGNPSGTGKGLTYLGDHAYATSGAVTNTTSYHNILDFTIGAHYIVGTFTLNGSVVTATVGAGNISVYQIIVNSETVALVKFDSQTENMPQSTTIPITLGPFDHVEVSVKADDTNGADTALFSGRVYA